MDPIFAQAADDLHRKYELLLSSDHYRYGDVPVSAPTSGVYLFSEQGRHLYVGRSNRLRKRYFLHCRPGSQHNQASFAFQLTKEALGLGEATYALGEGSRKWIAETEAFKIAFPLQKERIRGMDYRYVEETDQTRQALLEMYCAIVLRTPYNDFDTH